MTKEEIMLDDISKAIEKQRSWCDHDDLLEESADGLPIQHTYIFRCKCGKTRILRPPRDQMDRLREDMSFLHQEANQNENITELFGVRLIETKSIDEEANNV